MNLGLGSLQSVLQLVLDGLEIPKVVGSPIEKGYLAGLLVGRGERVLEAGIAITELVTAPLF